MRQTNKLTKQNTIRLQLQNTQKKLQSQKEKEMKKATEADIDRKVAGAISMVITVFALCIIDYLFGLNLITAAAFVIGWISTDIITVLIKNKWGKK